ncbi:hypothetical protein BI355_0927 [Companilactobacillus crustorum]|nr:hypothetical protein BI355_0927 [Companilactobacillus crustorum]
MTIVKKAISVYINFAEAFLVNSIIIYNELLMEYSLPA